jgi:hypothetical protein
VVVPFRLEHITLAERVELGCLGLLGAGQYGLITALASQLGTSRQFLYTLRARAGQALAGALAPGPPGRPALAQRVVVDERAVQRAILVLSQVAQAAVRESQECLGELLGVTRSVGYIEGVLQGAARRAQALGVAPPAPVHAEADELFAAGRPVLGVVERPSGAVLALVPAAERDETSWGCALLEVVARGTTLASLTADGAEGLRAGARAAGLAAPALDHWHTLRELERTRQLLEHQAYRALRAADRSARAAAAEAHRVLRPGGRLVLLEHVRSSSLPIRAVQRALDPLSVRFAADHLVRNPLDYLQSAGFEIESVQRLKLGIVERAIARKPGAQAGRHEPIAH